jgi:hypothetical protein
MISVCPNCLQSLGLVRAEKATVGALFKHRCCAILAVVAASNPAELVMRLATDAEKKAASIP